MAQKPSDPNQKPGAFGNKVVREDVLAAFNRGDKAALVSGHLPLVPEPKTEPLSPQSPIRIQGSQVQRTPEEQQTLNSVFLRAVLAKQTANVAVALNAGADINARFGHPLATRMFDYNGPLDHGDTALMRAVKNMDHIMVEFLLTNGANPNLDYNYGSFPYPSALTYAKRNNDSQMTALLKRYNATNEGSK